LQASKPFLWNEENICKRETVRSFACTPHPFWGCTNWNVADPLFLLVFGRADKVPFTFQGGTEQNKYVNAMSIGVKT